MNTQTKWILGILLLVLVVWGVTVSNKKEVVENTEPIKIGYVGPFTGPVTGTSGEDVGNGWKLAVAQRPTIAGRPVEVIYEDDACDPKKAASAANKLLYIDHVNIVVNGVCSGSMLAMAPLTEKEQKILFTPVSTSPKITTAGDYVFRTSGAATNFSSAIVAVLDDFEYKNIAIFYENAEYPVGFRDAMTEGLKMISDHKVVIEESVGSKDTDMRSQIAKIAQAQPDAVVVIMNSTVTANLFAKQAKELGVTIPIFGNEYFAFSDVFQQNPDAEGIYASMYKYDSNSSEFRDYVKEYQKTYGKYPGQEIYIGLPYDGYNVLADAIEACDGDVPACVRDELYKTQGYEGIMGTITIDANGDTMRETVIKKISGGQLVDF